MEKNIQEKKRQYSMSNYEKRRFAVGVVSCLVGAFVLLTPQFASAESLGIDNQVSGGIRAVYSESLPGETNVNYPVIRSTMSTSYSPQEQAVLEVEKGKEAQSQSIKFKHKDVYVDIPEGTTFKIDQFFNDTEKLPDGITVDPKTGVIRVSKDVPVGKYDVQIRVQYKDGSSNGITSGVDVKGVNYAIPLESAEIKEKEYKVKAGEEIILDIILKPVNASEQRFIWTYSKDDIVEITDTVNVDVENRSMHTLKALKEGRVEVIGTPVDDTKDVKPIKFTVEVSKETVEPRKPESKPGEDIEDDIKPEAGQVNQNADPAETPNENDGDKNPQLHDNNVEKPQWKQDNNGSWYVEEKGVKKTGWFEDKESYPGWYYFDNTGKMKTGWLQLGDIWYYLKSSGAMATGWQQVGGTWYYLKSSGAMATGWQQVGGTWYYLKSSGAMATGWEQVGGTWYYLKSGGAMATGREKINGTWYKFASSGAWIK